MKTQLFCTADNVGTFHYPPLSCRLSLIASLQAINPVFAIISFRVFSLMYRPAQGKAGI